MSAPTESDKTKRRNKNLTVEQIQEDSITQVLLGHLNALFGGSCMYNSISVCSALNEKVYTFMFFCCFFLTLQWLKNCTKNVSFCMIMVMLCFVLFFKDFALPSLMYVQITSVASEFIPILKVASIAEKYITY